MSPWVIEGKITNAKELAEMLGFRLEPGSYDIINVVANKEPYGKNTVLAKLNDWPSVELFLRGYQQGKLEQEIVVGLAKNRVIVSKAKKEKNGD